jgi:hypothetical protein
MRAMPIIFRERCRPMAGLAVLLFSVSAAQARTPVDFSLEREIRWRVAPAFTVDAAPADDRARGTIRPQSAPPRRPSHPENDATQTQRQGLTLLSLPFAF